MPAQFQSKKAMIARVLKLLATLPMLGLLSAQTPSRMIHARVVYFDRAQGDPQELYVTSGAEGGFSKIEPAQGVDGEPVPCPVDGAGKVNFLKSRSAADVAATAVIPQGVSRAVLFFLKNPKAGSNAYQVLVVDESRNAIPKGGSFICNLAGNNARLVLGELKYELPPGKSTSLKRPETLDDHNMASFQIAMQNGDSWKRVKDAMMRFSESERYFILTYLENGTRPAVKVFKQSAEIVEPAPAP